MKNLFVKLLLTTMIAAMLIFVFTACEAKGTYIGDAVEYKGDVVYDTDNSSIVIKSNDSVAEGQKLIKTCKIVAETKEFDRAVEAISNAITEAGGYIENQESHGQSYGSGNSVKTLILTARIPADKLDDFNSEMTGLMNVTSFSSNVDNVTEAYYSAEAKLEVLKAERDSLISMMNSLDKAEQYAFWGELQRQVSELEQDIAVLEAQLKNYDKQVSYSTVGINLTEVKELTDTNKDEPTFGERISDAFKESWIDFADGCQNFAVFFVGAIPTLIVLAVIAGIIFCIIYFPLKYSEKKRKQRMNQEQNKK